MVNKRQLANEVTSLMAETNTKMEQFLNLSDVACSTKKKFHFAMINHRVAMEHVLEAEDEL